MGGKDEREMRREMRGGKQATVKGNGKGRYNFTVSLNTRRRMEALKERSEADTLAEVMKNAIRVYEILLSRFNMGEKIEIGGKEVILVDVQKKEMFDSQKGL